MTQAATATETAEDAARLIALGLRPRQQPGRDPDYADLIRRFESDRQFEEMVHAIADGMGLMVLAVSARTGAVVAARPDSVFEVRMDDYAKRASLTGRSADRVLHGLIHMAIAALAFPRPDDLANDSYVGRVTVLQIEGVVREACRVFQEKAQAAEENTDPLVGEPESELVWRLFARRASDARTGDGRKATDSTVGMITKAAKWLVDQGLLVARGEDGGGTYSTTARYQVQVRELASRAAFDELREIGAGHLTAPSGTLLVSEPGVL